MTYPFRSYALALALVAAVPAAAVAQQPAPSQNVQINGSSLIGSTVRGADGKDIGKVHDVMVDAKEGRISSVVISMGATLGMGGKEMTVPWNAVQVGREEQKVVLTIQQELMPTAPKAQQDQGRDTSSGSASPPTTGQPQNRQ